MKLSPFITAGVAALQLSLAQASPAPVEVLGLEQPGFQRLIDHREIPARLDHLWKRIEAVIPFAESPAPILYLYPFQRAAEPARLSELQERARLALTPVPSLEDSEKFYVRLLGLTYDVALFKEGEADRGRVIQLNSDRLYTNEGPLDKGYGLYVSAHEMMHYALNRAGIDPKFHHCLMVEGRREGRDSLAMDLLNEGIKQQWMSEFLKRPLPRAKGYWEDQQHCEAEAVYFEREEKKEGRAPEFRATVKRLAQELP